MHIFHFTVNIFNLSFKKKNVSILSTESKEEAVELPEQITVEMVPRTTAAWLRVQNICQNPRVRFHVSVNRSLASITEHLQKKWRDPTDRLVSFTNLQFYFLPPVLCMVIISIFLKPLNFSFNLHY